MRRAFRLLPFALVLTLLACGTPQERCIWRATQELESVEELLAEVEGNLARGYAWEEYQQTNMQWVRCTKPAPPPPPGSPPQPPQQSMCFEPVTVTLQRRVAIDPSAETRKRDGLAAKVAELRRNAAAEIAQCRAIYPQ
ncbi:hypothetical protein [Phaeovulum sp.]|jgi:hypothetical protein|uniref:hypothetical protein n=1 Tax=Phaeovulum sp. TaxID=2934796 RepID=UPI002731BA9F|nr:hypothetical protein [Phaeovulum sp.]MDP1667975.1 hypothetical protein [Phaeovulum sp.]MDZ4119425.1 hypothetical protein [Phaeovulum sp.]